MKLERDEFVFSDGHRSYANGGLASVSIEDDHFRLYYGYDGRIDFDGDGCDWLEDRNRLHKHHVTELADYMIERWKSFKEKHGA